MKLKDLAHNPNNPRTIYEAKLKALKASMIKYGDLSGFIYNRQTKKMVGGHQRTKVMPDDAEIKIEKQYSIPTASKTVAEGYVLIGGERFKYREVQADEIWETEALIAANKHGGEWNNVALKHIIESIPDINLELIGFDIPEIEAFNIDLKPIEEKEFEDNDTQNEKAKSEIEEKQDQVPEVKNETNIKIGDLYALGAHRVLCGDSTDPLQVQRLMNGEKAEMVFTDPPYNIDYCPEDRPIGGRARSENKLGRIDNDKMSDDSFCEFLFLVNSSIAISIAKGGAIYECAPIGMNNLQYLLAWNKAGFHYSDGLVWLKNNHSISRKDYHPKHEIIHYGWAEGAHSWYGERNKFSVFLCCRDTVQDYKHPTQKPVELSEHFITNSSRMNEKVLDLFLGSGSTLIACEKTNRKCYGMEIDPLYVDVIIQRWEKFTGKKAVKIE